MDNNKKKIVLGFAALAVFIIVMAATAFFLKIKRLNRQLEQTKIMFKEMQTETKRLEEEKEKIVAEKEKLQADILSYLALNTSLEEDKKRLEMAVEESKRILEDKEAELQKAKLDLERLEEKRAKQETSYKSEYQNEVDELKKSIQTLEETIKKERGLYHYNLAVAYTQAKFYDDAIDAYQKSLEFDPDNPEAHYNLGLLYANFKDYPEKAIEHYRRYIELSPDAEDKEEVEAWIEKLK